MGTFRVTLAQLPKEVEDRLRGTVREIAGPALRSAAEACRGRLTKKTPVYTGMLKAGWRVKPLVGSDHGWGVENPVPYMGVIEKGARPHGVSKEGIEALTRWFELKGVKAQPVVAKPGGGGGRGRRRGARWKRLVARFRKVFSAPGGTPSKRAGGGGGGRRKVAPQRLSREEAEAAAQAFAWKLRKHGWKGTHFVERMLPTLEGVARAEVRRRLVAYAKEPAR